MGLLAFYLCVLYAFSGIRVFSFLWVLYYLGVKEEGGEVVEFMRLRLLGLLSLFELLSSDLRPDCLRFGRHRLPLSTCELGHLSSAHLGAVRLGDAQLRLQECRAEGKEAVRRLLASLLRKKACLLRLGRLLSLLLSAGFILRLLLSEALGGLRLLLRLSFGLLRVLLCLLASIADLTHLLAQSLLGLRQCRVPVYIAGELVSFVDDADAALLVHLWALVVDAAEEESLLLAVLIELERNWVLRVLLAVAGAELTMVGVASVLALFVPCACNAGHATALWLRSIARSLRSSSAALRVRALKQKACGDRVAGGVQHRFRCLELLLGPVRTLLLVLKSAQFSLLLGGEKGLGGCKIADPLIQTGEVLLNRLGVSARALESVDHAGLFRCECRSVHLEVVVGYAFVELCSVEI